MKRLIAISLPLILLVVGCGSSSKSSSSSSSPAASNPTTAATGAQKPSGGSVTVVMQNIAFNPGTITAKVGQTVKWQNKDSAPHNVTYVSGPKFASSSTFSNGGSYSIKLTKPGTIKYVCTIHPGMSGSITVTQ